MATTYKIHPALGIARVGNSPDDFFIGPERPGEIPEPPGGFKDSQCRVKRQAARFRVFAHHDDGTSEEVTDAAAEITWTVHLVNRKAANPGRGNTGSAAELTIDPGERTLSAPNQRQRFDTGVIRFPGQAAVTVPLGEVRSDNQGRLLVLGGFGRSASPSGQGIGDFWGNPEWYDDVADGPVRATLRLRTSNTTVAADGAWVIVAPPKFAPHQDSVISLYDRLLPVMVMAGHVPEPTTTSYTQDVYPILERARATRFVQDVHDAHAWPDPVYAPGLRQAIFARLASPGGGGGNMPRLNAEDGRLTPIQYAHLQRWKDGLFAQDWPGAPPPPLPTITPAALDRAALEACVGGGFYPGIEAGGRSPAERPILDPAHYREAFRLDHSVVQPGALSYTMALPWQADFYACGQSWWPAARPNEVLPQGTSTPQAWARGVGSYADMVQKWHTLGFVVKQGAQHVEVERCDSASVTLLTPVLHFQDVPTGPLGSVRETALAITFEVLAPTAAVTLEYLPSGAPNHPQLLAYNTSETVGPTAPNAVATARLWVIFRTGAAGSSLPPQVVTVRQVGSAQTFSVQILGNTIARKQAAAVLVLDRSGSMSEDRGDGQSKHDSLREAAGIFVDAMLEGDGVGVVRFNQDAQVLQPVLALGQGGLADVNRGATRDLLSGNGLDPSGQTSIGDGIFTGRGLLDGAGSAYDVRALVVLTDGIENNPRTIAEAAAQSREFTYAVGLGAPQNISVPALQTLSGNTGGYLLVTGAITRDNRFLLQKYFLQILASVSNAEVVLDPDGLLLPGRVQQIPFQVTRADSSLDVILLCPSPGRVDFRLQTPSGQLLEPWRAGAPGLRYVQSAGVSYYRLVLPVGLAADRGDHAGTWRALLTFGAPRDQRDQRRPDGIDTSILRGIDAQPKRSHAPQGEVSLPERRGLPYSLVVHSHSNLSLQASAAPEGFEPGARVRVRATLRESGLPLRRGAQVWVEVKRPDGSTATLALSEEEDGRFAGALVTAEPGVYQLRVRARGQTRRGEAFARERLLTAAVWRGGDRPQPTPCACACACACQGRAGK